MKNLRAACRIAFAVVATGCGAAGDGDPSLDAAVSGWRVSDQPALSIGSPAGEAPYLFHIVLAGTRLSDGRVVILEGGTELRYFGQDGSYLRTVGRRGTGPGEFMVARQLLRLGGDTILVLDTGRNMISRLSPEGDVLDTRLVEYGSVLAPGELGEFPLHLLPDGRLLVGGVRRHPAGTAGMDSVRLVIAGGDRPAVVLGVFAHQERYARGSTLANVAGGGLLIVAAGPDAIAVTNTAEPRIRLFGHDGSMVGDVAWDQQADPVTRADIERYGAAFCQLNAEDSEACRAAIGAGHHAATHPVTSGIFWDSDGLLWVRRHGSPQRSPEQWNWQIFDARGRLVERAALAVTGHPLDIGRAHVLVLAGDSFGVPTVRLFDLHR